jgi:hypothetical protein
LELHLNLRLLLSYHDLHFPHPPLSKQKKVGVPFFPSFTKLSFSK